MTLLMLLTRSDSKNNYAAAVSKDTFDHEYSRDSVIVTLSIALSLYNSLEMILIISSTFKKWRGLYFWSLSICNLGVILYALGMLMTYFRYGPLWLGKTILDIGWVAMLVCQSLVLYSRLGLIVSDARIISAVKWMIIVNSSLLCTIVIILDFGSTYSTDPSFSHGYYYIEQCQLILFTLQEVIISGLYVWKTLAMLRVISKEHTRSMIFQLLIINIIIICMDIALILLQFLHFQLYQESVKAFVYSVKLKLEIHILSKLVNVVSTNQSSRAMTLDFIDSSAIAAQDRDEIRREMREPDFKGDNRGSLQKIAEDKEIGPLDSASSSQRTDEKDEITRIQTNTSVRTSRTKGRESDILYADFVRSMS